MSLPADLRYEGRGLWSVLTTFTYSSRYGVALVRAGFKTDLASVPRLPFVYLIANDRAVVSAVIHDALYKDPYVYPVPADLPFDVEAPKLMLKRRLGTRKLSRRQADKAFREAMVAEGVKRRHRWPIYLGVRVGGWRPWRRYRNEEADRNLPL